MKGLEEQLEDEENSEIFTKALIFLSKNNQEYFNAVINKLNDIKTILMISLSNDISVRKQKLEFNFYIKLLISGGLISLFTAVVSIFNSSLNILTVFSVLINTVLSVYLYVKFKDK